MSDSDRRTFIRQIGQGSAALASLPVLGLLGGCGSDDNDAPSTAAPTVRYDHGVASGDPLADRVVLWTRLTPTGDAPASIGVRWEVAADSGFGRIIASGTTLTDTARDWTVKVDAAGLTAGTRYWYRFSVGAQQSAVGRTRTLPDAAARQVRLAVFSCANYPAGFFNAYAHAALRDDLDATVHLGDYIYEYPRSGYASANAAALGREVLPVTELLTLADYRTRHAQYRSDPDLQALHAVAPMIAVWDDHEIANDTWSDGAEDHQSSEGSFAARRAAAIQAYHEWLPTRVGDPTRIWRSFDFGRIASLHMLDTRVHARSQPLGYADYITAGGFDTTAFTAAMSDPARGLLGTEQSTWLAGQVQASRATWQLLGQQVLMGRMNIPAPILFEAEQPGSGVSFSAYAALLAKGQANPAALTAQEKAILAQPSIPYNLDAWDGYPVAREQLLGTLRVLDRNIVVLAGDTHNAWASDLDTAGGQPVGVEFATPAVSSPGLEEYLPGEDPAALAAGLTQLIGPLQYCDTSRRGYLLLTVSDSECRADWIYVAGIGSRSSSAGIGQSLRVLPGSAGRRVTGV